MTDISVIVSTYNRPDALGACLRSLGRQTTRNFEIVVADDGSGSVTRDVIDAWKPKLGIPLKHVWQEDRGFRLAESRNRAIAASDGDYLVFLDGDCIAPSGFVAAHRALAEPGYFVGGNRVLLSRALTEDVLANNLEPERWSFAGWALRRARGEINRLLPLMSLPLGPLRKRLATAWEGVRGGNFAFHRADLERVDGFETSFTGWGLEDSDIVIRMIRAGARRKDGRFATGVLHLWHPDADRSALAANQALLDELMKSDRVRALSGLSALTHERAAVAVGQ
ncbi:MAG: glycosyltransferase family 2 protein [Xanthobacteraceae bacterium]